MRTPLERHSGEAEKVVREIGSARLNLTGPTSWQIRLPDDSAITGVFMMLREEPG
jgi:hypothetical protein